MGAGKWTPRAASRAAQNWQLLNQLVASSPSRASASSCFYFYPRRRRRDRPRAAHPCRSGRLPGSPCAGPELCCSWCLLPGCPGSRLMLRAALGRGGCASASPSAALCPLGPSARCLSQLALCPGCAQAVRAGLGREPSTGPRAAEQLRGAMVELAPRKASEPKVGRQPSAIRTSRTRKPALRAPTAPGSTARIDRTARRPPRDSKRNKSSQPHRQIKP